MLSCDILRLGRIVVNLAKDPVCGMVVDVKTALSSEIGGRHF